MVEAGQVRAAWIIDYPGQRIIWSTGHQRVYENQTRLPLLPQMSPVKLFGADAGYFFQVPRTTAKRYLEFFQELHLQRKLDIVNLASSIQFAYVSTGQIQAATVLNAKPWDALAAAFLVEQNGGLVSDFGGRQWTINTQNFIFAVDRKTHNYILRLLKKHRLMNLR